VEDYLGPYFLVGILLIVMSLPIFWVYKKAKQKDKKLSKIEEQIDDTTVFLLFILSFVIPLAGFIVGAIYASKDEEHYKHVGKMCLIFSVMNIVLGFIMIASLFT